MPMKIAVLETETQNTEWSTEMLGVYNDAKKILHTLFLTHLLQSPVTPIGMVDI